MLQRNSKLLSVVLCFCIILVTLASPTVSIRILAAVVPIDNPVAAYYSGSSGYPAWTDSIRWSNVINMSYYTNGSNDFERFENARDQLYAQGGGVLYYPAGTYDFSNAPLDGPNGRGLMLKSGVVIRGETPGVDSNGTDGSLGLPTKFIFPLQTKSGGNVPHDWSLIGLMPASNQGIKDVNNVGVIWVDVVGATVFFGPQVDWGSTWATAASWKSSKVKSTWANRIPDGTHPMDTFTGGGKSFIGSGSGRLVMGCKFQDSAVLNDAINEGFDINGFHTYKFGPRVGVYGSRVFIANNVLPKSNKNFKYSQLTSSGTLKTILFDYGKTCGIDVNKELLGYCSAENNGFFSENVEVRDNYVYNHGHKGFNVSGKWVVLKNNHNERDYLQEGDDRYGLGTGYELTIDGYVESQAGGVGSVSDNLSRAFDIGGKILWVDGNSFNNTGSDPGNDGEGILCQAHGGTQLYSWAITHNTHTQGAGETGYIGGYDVTHYGSLISWNTTPGWVGNNKAGGQIDSAFVDNTAALGVKTTGTDVITSAPSGTPASPTNVSASVVNDYVDIQWADNADNEVGFRVDRSIDGGVWTPIAYRPRHSTGTDENPQAWRDINAPAAKELKYRVAAINIDDGNTGISSATTPVTINMGATPTQTITPTDSPTITPTVTPTFTPPQSGQKVEAESMNLVNYGEETNSSASGGKCIKLSANSGTASFSFDGNSGNYGVKVVYFDENDGVSTYKLYVNNVLIDSWSADRDLGSGSAVAKTLTERTVQNVQLNSGEQIKIEGSKEGGENGRVDYIEILGISSTPTVTPTVTQTPTQTPTPTPPQSGQKVEAESMSLVNYGAETNSSASGGKCIKLSANSGTASFSFNGTSGNYGVKVVYFDENDGVSTYKLYVNNVLIDSWSADRDLGSGSAVAKTLTERTVQNVQLNSGEQIKIEGSKEGGENGRVDYIEVLGISSTPTVTPTPTITPTVTPTPTLSPLPRTPVDPLSIKPEGSTWESGYQQRVSKLVNAKTWTIGNGAGNTDAGKKDWSALLAEMWKVRDNSGSITNYINNQGRTLILSKYAGTFYKPFSCPGYTLYYNKYKSLLPAEQKNKAHDMIYSEGWNQMMREDGHIDPIYSLTEYNSENFVWMSRLMGYLWAEEFNDTEKLNYFKNFVDNWAHAAFNSGRVEWDSNNYFGYCFQPALVLYEYAKDSKVKKQAKAVLDWMMITSALHYIDGFQAGPDVRAKTFAYKPFEGSTWPYAYWYFVDSSHHPSYSDSSAVSNMDINLAGFIPYSSYRPPQVALDIAQRKFQMPLEMHNAKPFYCLDFDNYHDWKGDTNRSRRFEYETLYFDKNYLLGSLATNRPNGDAAMNTQNQKPFSEQSVWRLAVKGSSDGAVQIFGNSGSDNDMAGRCPYEEIGQYRNSMMRLIKGTDRMWVCFPSGVNVEYSGEKAFANMGNNVYVAVIPYNSTGRSDVAFSDTNYRQYIWNFDTSKLGGLTMEVGTADEHGSYTQFKNNINNKALLTAYANDQLEYTSSSNLKLKMQFMPTSTYTMVDGTVINPAGVLPKVWADGQLIDFSTWNCYEVVYGEKIVEQQWGSGTMKATVGNKGLEMNLDDVTANVNYWILGD